MKTVITASLVLTLCLVSIIVNCIYIKSSSDEMLRLLEDCGDSEKVEESIQRFNEVWEKKRFPLSIGVNLVTIEEIDRLNTQLLTYYRLGQKSDYKAALEQLKDAIGDMVRNESLTAEGVL